MSTTTPTSGRPPRGGRDRARADLDGNPIPRSARLGAHVVEVFAQPDESLGRTALLSGAFSLAPVFAAVLLLTLTSSFWPVIVLGEIIVACLFFAVYIRFRLVHSAITPDHFLKRRMLLSPVSVDLGRVDRVLINRVYRTSSTEALLQLLAIDNRGHRLFGLSALFWSDDDIRRVADHLGIPTTVDNAPLSRTEYYAAFPMARGWYARRPARAVMVLAATALVAVGALVVNGWVHPA